MIEVTINGTTTRIQDLRHYAKILELEYLKKDLLYNSAMKEIEELKKQLTPLNKALSYKYEKVKKKSKDDEFLARFRASQLL